MTQNANMAENDILVVEVEAAVDVVQVAKVNISDGTHVYLHKKYNTECSI